MSGVLTLSLCGQTLVLHPDRALFWSEAGMLIVADAHFGKPQAFREHSIPLPRGTTRHDLARLSGLTAYFQPAHLLFLGDLMHGALADRQDLDDRAARWRQRHRQVQLHLVSGNHDRRAGAPPAGFGFEQVAPELAWPPFVFRHQPKADSAGFSIAGHLHPAVVLTGRGRQKETLPCFWFGRQGGVLPAFGSFTGNQVIRPAPDDGVYVVAGETVCRV